MTMNRREFVVASVAGAAMMQQGMKALAAPGGDLQVTIDATKVGEPVNPLLFGGYMEPATTRVWAEMLTDRKFLRAINDTTPPPRGFGGGRFQMGRNWKPFGPPTAVEMDTVNPFVGEHSPRIMLDATEVRGIRAGRTATGQR